MGNLLKFIMHLFLAALIILMFWGISSGQSNEQLAKWLVKENWRQLENNVEIAKTDSLVFVRMDESSPVGLYFFSSLNTILLQEGFKNIFLGNRSHRNGIRIESYLKSLSIQYVPIKAGLFRKKKYRRIAELKQMFRVVNAGNAKLLWSGDLESVKQDTLLKKRVFELQKNQLLFLQGKIKKGKNPIFTYLRLGFLTGVSIAVVVLFFSVRTT